jgi:hypothetical protein
MNAMTEIKPLNFHRHAHDLRDTWQARCLAEAKGKTAAVVLIVLCMSYSTAIKTLLRVVFNQRDIQRPFFCSGAEIQLSGKLVCDLVERSGIKHPVVVYESTDELNRDMRDLAERLKLKDSERLEFTAAIQRWVVADHRVDHLGKRLVN